MNVAADKREWAASLKAHGMHQQLRREVRAFVTAERARGSFLPSVDSWLQAHSPDFSRKLAAKGWLGMTWPVEYGGGGRDPSERIAVLEELVLAGAPLAAHWVAENQAGPMLLSFGSEEQRQYFLPRIARGEMYMAAGLSEPDSGSDLASIRTKAERISGGWRVSGRKIWSSNGQNSHFLLALVRTASGTSSRHDGFSQFFIDLSSSGVSIAPIGVMGGDAPFAEITFDDVFVPDAMVLGKVDDGWRQVTSMLVFERCGPERYLSTAPLLSELIDSVAVRGGAEADLGLVAAKLMATRALANKTRALGQGNARSTYLGAIVKDIAAQEEQEVVAVARRALADGVIDSTPANRKMIRDGMLTAPTFSIRGGTVQILRNVVAKELRHNV